MLADVSTGALAESTLAASYSAVRRYDDDADEELLRLLPFLDSLAGADDVRPHIQAHFKLRQLVESTPDPPPRKCLGAFFGC
jgi:hypothetical protein